MVEWFFDEKFVEVQIFLGLIFLYLKNKICKNIIKNNKNKLLKIIKIKKKKIFFYYCYSVKIFKIYGA